ncbi:AfsR/SARP family transcriptional regulator [Actinomycetospora chibensis]|uniref:BTAD domain-containing putative transcriptional regulator n=1 Tax=Actinomycetospora chibensis TaxID=663606 RepID=A0ABV9RPZ0_9PSEU|nr:BTAD domain-containing putative transcriptional regulator [Actinomycetospora chibensis]MDD7926975.1 BTAD domain-containing putative transcriptional regulator [Actinomycetospora chibensis]
MPATASVGRPEERRCALRLLGGFHLVDHGRPATLSETARRLVALLALRGPMTRRRIAGYLWPEATERRAQGCLRTAMWRLGRDTDVLCARTDVVRLAPDVWVDVDVFLSEIRSLTRGDRSVGAALCTHGEHVLERRDLLPEWDDDWVVLERERLRQLHMHALEELATLWADEGRWREALDAALQAVGLEPLRESARRVVIGIHLREGNVVEALRHFDEYRVLVRRELGIEPSGHLTKIISAACSMTDR